MIVAAPIVEKDQKKKKKMEVIKIPQQPAPHRHQTAMVNRKNGNWNSYLHFCIALLLYF
jgi:hypothetical protein